MLDHGGDGANLYDNDIELLADANEKRLWDWFYLDKCVFGDAKLRPEEIQALITEAISTPVKEPSGQQRAPNASEVIDNAIKLIEEHAYAKIKPFTVGTGQPNDTNEHGLTLDEAAMLTQIYLNIKAKQGSLSDRQAFEKFYDNFRVACTTDEQTKTKLEGMIGAQLSRLFTSAGVLEAYDDTAMTGQVKDLRACLLASHEDYLNKGRISKALQSQMRGVQKLDGWKDRKSIIVYNAIIGAPVYCFPRVLELKGSYDEIRVGSGSKSCTSTKILDRSTIWT